MELLNDTRKLLLCIWMFAHMSIVQNWKTFKQHTITTCIHIFAFFFFWIVKFANRFKTFENVMLLLWFGFVIQIASCDVKRKCERKIDVKYNRIAINNCNPKKNKTQQQQLMNFQFDSIRFDLIIYFVLIWCCSNLLRTSNECKYIYEKGSHPHTQIHKLSKYRPIM